MKPQTLAISLCLFLVGAAPAQDSLNVRLVGSWPDGSAVAVDSARHLAFVGTGIGIDVLDVSNPALPVKLSELRGSDDVTGLCYTGSNRLYVADRFAGLLVIAVDDPAHPAELGCYDTTDEAWDVAVKGDYAYLADDRGLRVISIADPAHPHEVDHYDTPGPARGVAVSGDLAYVADDLGLRVVSIADPAHPLEVGHYDMALQSQGLAVSGDYVYVATWDAGLRVISVADPTHPFRAGYCTAPTWGYRVAVKGQLAYVADYVALRVISIADPTQPTEVGYYVGVFGSALDVTVVGEHIYIAGFSGLQIFKYFGDNPLPVIQDVLWLPPTKQPRAASLLNALGQKVADLREGANDVSRLAPGVYFVREAQAQAHAQAIRKVVITR